uniref:Heparan-alpha-glucosaminide N-acetyltransferase catalytic domain-containing protein n=1 Tax=Fusarium oxysporum (strain Fo5176) TaxID=660025 RepID=A0A0D2YBJ5_FUSOF
MPSAQSSHDDPTDRRPDVSYGSFPADTPPQPSKPTQPSTRALAPDLLRGLLMLLMAMDHMALALNTWSHGTGRETEMDGVLIRRWNRTPAYIIRTLTHLCAPGFTMLLGIGVVYLGRSRKKLGWSSGRIARYFFIRAFVLAAVNVVLGWVITVGKVWFMNFVLFSLAVDYLLAGLLATWRK